MKKTAKIFSLFLAVIIAMSAFSISGFAVATELEAGNSKETAANIPEFGVEYVSSLSEAGEVDWFKFTTLSEGAYYTVALENYNLHNGSGERYSLNLYIFDDYNKKLVNIQGTQKIDIKLQKNTTYYIKVNMGEYVKNSTGNYSICISYKLDPISNVKEEATDININTIYKYSLDGKGDVDWFKFTTTYAGKYKVVLENYNLHVGSGERYSLNLYVFDVYDKKLANQQGKGSIEVSLEENTTYYVKINMGEYVNSSIGNYGFSVNYDAPVTLTSISLASAPSKTEYLIGDTLNVNGLSVEAEYSDGTKKTVEGYSITGFESLTVGKKTVTVTYTENGVTCTCTFDVTVSVPAPAVELTSIAYVTLPEKTTYKVGEGLNDNGLTVSAKYSDGSTKLINNYTLSGFDSSTAGVKTVTVSYTENGITKTCTFSVTVLAEKKLIAVSVASMPTKTVYQTGEEFDASGLIVNAFYDDGTTAFVTDYTVSGFDSETAGTKTVVVTYTDKGVTKSCTFEVTVEEAENTGNFFTDLINSIMNFFMSIIEFFTSLLGG